jgi:hypothetical protein
VSPNGPTNLQAALEAIAASADRSLPNELLIISDTDAAISDPAALGKNLIDAHVRVSVLSIGESQPNNALAQISSITKGRFVQQRDAAQWPATMRELARSVSPDYLLHGSASMTFNGPLSFLAPRAANLVNRTWLKNGATQAGTAQSNDEQLPAAGEWQLGGGRVIAIATDIVSDDANAIADRFGQLPSDPRFKVRWDDASRLSVRMNASDSQQFMNDRTPTVELLNPASGATESHAMIQTGPGEYELSLQAPSEPLLATIHDEGRIISRFAVVGHYPREFYPLGNDRAAMRKLADMSGGEVIEPSDNRPINFHWPIKRIALAPWFVLIGLLAIGAALIRWRHG